MPQDVLTRKSGGYVTQNRSTSLVSLGSNLTSAFGDPRETLAVAVQRMRECGLVIRAESSIWRTPAYPAGAGPDFANAALEVKHSGDAHTVMRQLHEIERSMGRERGQRWGARTLDLDLIATGDLVLPDRQTVETWMRLPPELQSQTSPTELILPHPRLQDRAFVLVPLSEIAGDWCHPLLAQSIDALCAALPGYLRDEVRPFEV